MATIIRAGEENRAVQRTSFNFEDLANRAETYLAGVRAEAAKILAKAEKDAVQLRQRAEAEGSLEGRRQAEQYISQQLEAKLGTLVPALRASVMEIQHARHAWMKHWQKSALGVAIAIAAKVIRREVAAEPEISVDLIRQALELAAGQAGIRVRLHPNDLETLRPRVDILTKTIAGLGAVELVGDPSISAGGCRVETRFGSIDQQFETQLARIFEELT